ncbi:MAG: ankyrin repeat domain-containing protein [Pirellulaceae bacterium]
MKPTSLHIHRLGLLCMLPLWLPAWLTGSCQVLEGAEPALANAVEKQDQVTVRKLLASKADVNRPQADGMTALHWAVYLDDMETAEALVLHGASVACQNRYGVTPLSLACTNGTAKIVALLLANGANPNATLRGGETILMTAARTGRASPVRMLLARGAKVNAKERNDQTALMWAAAEGHLEVVDLLLEAGADFRTPLESGYTPLMFAVREGHTAVVKRFLKAGIDVNSVMQPERSSSKGIVKGTSSLTLAIENGHFELAGELLKAGADPNDARTNFTPLLTLSWVRKPAIGDDASGDPSPIGSGNLTSLQLVQALIKHGAEVNFRKKNNSGRRGKFGRKGTTAFLCAAGTGDVAFMRLLLELGADPEIPNDRNWTPLMMAAGMGTGSSGDSPGTEEECLEAVQLLVTLGANVNAVDRNGETAMHGAAYKTMPSVVNYLDRHGADIKIWSKKTKNGRTPLWIAQGYRGGGNFKPSFETVNTIKKVMLARGVTPPPPPRQELEKGYRPN